MPSSGAQGRPPAPHGGQEQLSPIVRQNLHHVVATRLRDMITEGDLAPGTRIHEVNLGQELGVSRTPLREALKCLAGEGLLDLSPGRGAIVRVFKAKDVEDSLNVLARLEHFAGFLVCAHATGEAIRRIRLMHDEMIRLYEAGSRRSYFKTNQAIHSAILQATGNSALVDVHNLLQGRLRRIRYIGHEGPEKWADAVRDHQEIIVALESRDGERLATVLAEHIQKTWERVKTLI